MKSFATFLFGLVLITRSLHVVENAKVLLPVSVSILKKYCTRSDGQGGVALFEQNCHEEMNEMLGYIPHRGTVVCCPTETSSQYETESTTTLRTRVETTATKATTTTTEVPVTPSKTHVTQTIVQKTRVPGAEARKHCTADSSFRSFLIDKVIEGRDSAVGEFPHQVALGWRSLDGDILFQCGGALISNRFVLTAAHCVIRNPLPSFVRMGRTDLVVTRPANETHDNGRVLDVEIKTIIRHPDYRSSSKYDDIALLELKNEVTFTDYILPVCLQCEDDVNDVGRELHITGWGYTDTDLSKKAEWLQTAKTTDISIESCRKDYESLGSQLTRSMKDNIRPTQLCAQNPINKLVDACQGDSGSPLNYLDTSNNRYYAVGIVSAGSFCGTPLPGLYTRVSQYIDWIEGIVWPSNQNDV